MLRVQRVALLSILLVAWLAVPAHAAFPGQNGRLVLGEFNTPISTINPNGTDLRTVPVALPANTSLLSRVRWSPDGTKLLLTTASKPNGCLLKASAYNIRVVNADGTGLRNVTQPTCVNGAGIHDQQADWSPDGRQIVF